MGPSSPSATRESPTCRSPVVYQSNRVMLATLVAVAATAAGCADRPVTTAPPSIAPTEASLDKKPSACSTCHLPAFATGDGKSLSVGEGGAAFGPERRYPDGVFFRETRRRSSTSAPCGISSGMCASRPTRAAA